MAASTTIRVPHLGGITVGYMLNNNNTYDPSKPTCVLINSFCTTVALFRPQFECKKLTDTMNLLAIEPLGHGATSMPAISDHFTYWDTAAMALQVMDALGIEKAFALGTSQGGWVVARMALLAPARIRGIMPLGTSMDSETGYSRSKGCWNPAPLITPFVDKWTTRRETPDFVVDDVWCEMVVRIGFGEGVIDEETIQFWKKTVSDVYRGDEGRRKVRMTAMSLLSRDGLLVRLRDIRCPVHWMQGDRDAAFGSTLQLEQMRLITGSKDVKITFLQDCAHYLNATNPDEVNDALVQLVNMYSKV